MPSVHARFYESGSFGWEVDYRENGKRARIVFGTKEQAERYMLQQQLRIAREHLHVLEQQIATMNTG